MGRILLIALGVVVAMILGVFTLGAIQPVEHEASVTMHLNQSPEVVWDLISDYQNGPSWRPDVHHVEMLSVENGNISYIEIGDFGEMPLEVIGAVEYERLEIMIADDQLPWGGVWTYELRAVNGGTEIRITEDGFVKSPIFRFMNVYVFGPDATIKLYLTNLANHFGEEPEFSL